MTTRVTVLFCPPIATPSPPGRVRVGFAPLPEAPPAGACFFLPADRDAVAAVAVDVAAADRGAAAVDDDPGAARPGDLRRAHDGVHAGDGDAVRTGVLH